MARMGDEDEVGRGASVAQLSDAARRRSERAPNPGRGDVPPAPDPSAGIDLITNVRADEHDAHVEALVDDVLDEALAGQWGAPEAALRASPAREGPEDESATDPIDPGQGDHQHVREVLEHHHERRNPRELPTRTPRGSADLAPPVRRSSAPRERRPLVKAAGRTRTRRRVAGGLAAVIAIVGIVVIAAEAGSSAAKHHGTPAAVTQATIQGVSSPSSVIASDMTRATAAIGVEGKTAASAHAAMKTKEKARAEARARARSKAAERARAARVRRHQAAAARAPASSTAGSTAAGSTGATTTEPAYNPPSSPTSSTSTASTSGSGGGSGSSSAPAGPTGIGSAGGSCNPKCS